MVDVSQEGMIPENGLYVTSWTLVFESKSQTAPVEVQKSFPVPSRPYYSTSSGNGTTI